MKTSRQASIFWIIYKAEPIGISGIFQRLTESISIPTLNRDLADLKRQNFILSEGTGPATKYRVNLEGLMHAKIDQQEYFQVDADDRIILEKYNVNIFDLVATKNHFSSKEKKKLDELTKVFQTKLRNITPDFRKREFERLVIELSWKSSQIEGNTYDLLDTEQLLKYNIPATGHSPEEAIMLLNHKTAFQYIHENPKEFFPLSVSKIIDVHTLLTKDLGISKNIRNRLVRITGTRYTPPDNQFVIEEGLEKLCTRINKCKDAYEKALLAILLISYLQPFNDGNKRTARLIANAVLLAEGKCPLSFRSINPSDYKKAVMLFYELNNVTAFKEVFLEQYQFAAENYF